LREAGWLKSSLNCSPALDPRRSSPQDQSALKSRQGQRETRVNLSSEKVSQPRDIGGKISDLVVL